MSTTATTRNWTFILTATVVRMFMVATAAVSFTHIRDTSQWLGLGWEAWTVPFLIDGIAALGLIGRSEKFAASTRRAGTALTLIAGSLSLTCNILAGHNLGQRLYGVLIVGGFIATETYAGKLRPAPVAPTQPTAAEVAAADRAARRSAAARKGAATKKAKAEIAAREAAKANRAERARIRAAEQALATS